MKLRDFQCDNCQLRFEALADGDGLEHPCPLCGQICRYVLTFQGSVGARPPGDAEMTVAETSPGKDLGRPWEQDREFSKTRDITKKLDDGRQVRRISMDVSENLPKREVNRNVALDIKRSAAERRNK